MRPRTTIAAAGPIPLYPSEERLVVELYGEDGARAMLPGWDGAAQVLERDGLPRRDPLFGNRRYWPAVREWLQRRNGVASSSARVPAAPDGEENWG